MQKIGVYIILLVIGTVIGASIMYYVPINQTPSTREQVKVTIQGIDYKVSDSVLEIELLNDVPEKNLEGKVIVSQDENQWTCDVTWHYTGLGVAEVICDSINETQNFRITYIENNPKATYLDRNIEWNEVSQTFTFMETEQLTISKVEFGSAATQINATVMNTGTSDVVVNAVTVSGSGVTGSSIASTIIAKGTTVEVPITVTTGAWSAGKAYNVELLSTKGNKFTYTGTA